MVYERGRCKSYYLPAISIPLTFKFSQMPLESDFVVPSGGEIRAAIFNIRVDNPEISDLDTTSLPSGSTSSSSTASASNSTISSSESEGNLIPDGRSLSVCHNLLPN